MRQHAVETRFPPNASEPTPKRDRLLAALLVASLSLTAPAKAVSPNETVRLDTAILSRELVVDAGRLSTREIVSGGRTVSNRAIAAEFLLRLADGRLLGAEDYRVVGRRSTEKNGQRRESFDLAAGEELPRVRLEYLARAGDHFLRKRMTVEGSVTVAWAAVETLAPSEAAELGGLGQPLFLDGDWFLGLEHPAGEQRRSEAGVWTLACHPGRSSFRTPWAVFGVREPESTIEDAFQRYLSTIRRPLRPLLQYNSWYDLRGDELNPESLRATFERFRESLLEPYDLTFDAFVIDDGYQEPRSLWRPRWDEGLAPLARELERHGTRLGLWLPLNGTGLDTSWGAEQGFEIAPHRKDFYLLTDPEYQRAIRDAVAARIREGNLAYLKHDFNHLDFADSTGQGIDLALREACVDVELALLEHERREQPSIVLNVTSGLWPSPWWLMGADAIWMGSSDYAQDWTIPQPSERAAETTFRDETLHRLLRIDRAQVPPSSLMTHGLIRGRYEGIDPGETPEEWADYVMAFFGRGSMLHELYVTPEEMPADHWKTLGQAIRWARANAETLAHTRMIGGRPAHGEAYGFVHWSEKKGILAARNPSTRPTRLRLTTGERPAHLTSVDHWRPVIIYPHREVLTDLDRLGSVDISLPASSVVVVELFADPPLILADLPPGPFGIETDGSESKILRYARPSARFASEAKSPTLGRKTWQAHYRLANPETVLARELSIVRLPARAMTVSVRAGGDSVTADRRNDPQADAWDLTVHSLPPDACDLEIDAWLPPSPFYPERCRLEATLRTTVRLRPIEERAMVGELPVWPRVLRTGSAVLDETLLEDRVFDRRRAPIESLGWVAALGVAPAVLVHRVTRRVGRTGSKRRQWLVRFAIWSGWASLYLLTPLSTGLARALL